MYHPVSYAAGRLQRFSTAKGLGNYYRDEYTHGSGPTDAFVYAHQKRAATYNTPPQGLALFNSGRIQGEFVRYLLYYTVI